MMHEYTQYIQGGIAILPRGMKRIDGFAFRYCDYLSSVIIPSSVEEIEEGAFTGCIRLESFYVSPKNPSFYGSGSCLLTKDGSKLIAGCKNPIIPPSVKVIGSWSFYDLSNLFSIEIPDSVAVIESFAFSGCENLSSIEIPNSVVKIGQGAFIGCKSLSHIDIPDSVAVIEGQAFYDCIGLTHITIPQGVSVIEYATFLNCTNLKSVGIPNSVIAIGNRAFSNCKGLKSIELPQSIKEIGEDAFEQTGLTSIKLPNSIIKIGDGAFSGCEEVTNITIPENVTEIGSRLFWGCSKMETITVHSSNSAYSSSNNCILSKDGKTVVAGCNNSTIPEGVTRIGDSAFSGCSRLSEIRIPDSVWEIGECAFSYCASLTTIEIPKSVTSIQFLAFDGCTALVNIDIQSDYFMMSIDEAFSNCPNIKSITVRFESPLEAESVLGKSGLQDLNQIVLYTPIGTGYAYRHNNFFKQFLEVIPNLRIIKEDGQQSPF